MSDFSNRIGAPVPITAVPLDGHLVDLCCARLIHLDGAIIALAAGTAVPLLTHGVEALRLVEGIRALLLDVLVDGSEAHEHEVRDVVGRIGALLSAMEAAQTAADTQHRTHTMLALASATQGGTKA